jgi:hypothetical protein
MNIIYPPSNYTAKQSSTESTNSPSQVIAPAWATQPWCAVLLEMLVDYPALLPISQKTHFSSIQPAGCASIMEDWRF